MEDLLQSFSDSLHSDTTREVRGRRARTLIAVTEKLSSRRHDRETRLYPKRVNYTWAFLLYVLASIGLGLLCLVQERETDSPYRMFDFGFTVV